MDILDFTDFRVEKTDTQSLKLRDFIKLDINLLEHGLAVSLLGYVFLSVIYKNVSIKWILVCLRLFITGFCSMFLGLGFFNLFTTLIKYIKMPKDEMGDRVLTVKLNKDSKDYKKFIDIWPLLNYRNTSFVMRNNIPYFSVKFSKFEIWEFEENEEDLKKITEGVFENIFESENERLKEKIGRI